MTGKQLVLWPARQYAEDIEFHHMCENSKMAVVKCNRFFFHKANLQGKDLKKAQKQPRIVCHPVSGPMWGVQQLTLDILPQVHRLDAVSICGAEPVSVTQVGAQLVVVTPPLTGLMAKMPHSDTVLTGDIVVSWRGTGLQQITAAVQYTYHGLAKWSNTWPLVIDLQAAGRGKL